MDPLIETLSQIPDFDRYISVGMLIFSRMLAFMFNAPAFNRQDVPSIVKLSLAFLMTISFFNLAPIAETPQGASYWLSLCLNIVFGALLGFVANVIFKTIESGGEMMNMQMGLQTAVMFDSSAKSQISIMGKFFAFLGVLIYIEIGGLYWLFSAFERSFEIFPLYSTSIPLDKFVNMEQMITLTGNVLFIGLQLAAPILLTTLCQDIILGIISKTAPQINVFQLSFVFKPTIGAIILFLTLPLLVNTITDYFVYYSKIF